jgi:hypothetical protein
MLIATADNGADWLLGVRVPATARGGELSLKKIISWGIFIFIVFYLATQPTAAAHVMTTILDGIKSIGHSLAIFFNSL